MSLHAVNIQGINITKSSKENILKEVEKYLDFTAKSESKPLTIVTPNPEQIVISTRDSHFAELLNRADVAIPDGIGLLFARPNDIKKTIPGVEFMEDLVSIAANRHVPIALIGGSSRVAVEALECLRQNFPDLIGVAMDAPMFSIEPSGLAMSGNIDEYFKKLANDLNKQKIGMVFVALGAPKQEFFIEKILQFSTPYSLQPTPLILMSVGGSFDEISGRIPRAPKWVSSVGLKWLWRLFLEPWRIKRQLALLHFVWLVFKNRYISR